MVDKVSLEAFKDMLRRYNAFKEKNGREPAWVQTPDGGRVQIKDFLDMKRRYNEFMAREGREPRVIHVKAQDKVDLKGFKDMKTRYEAFIEKNNREPAWIATPQGGRVNLTTFKDMLDRYTTFLDENKREPKVIYMKGTTKDTGWVTTGYYKQDKQDTGYTCGPSSLQMALSALGCNVSEDVLAKAGGTGTSGTGHEGMLRAVEYASRKCKMKISARFQYFNGYGWGKVVDGIKAGAEYVIHLKPLPALKYDYKGSLVWRSFTGGHYVYLVGVNMVDRLVLIADPTKGLRIFGMKQVEDAIARISKESLLILRKG